MSSGHTSYDENDPLATMRADAAAAGRHLRLASVARVVAQGPPSLAYADYPREVIKREITVDEAATRIANALNLYLD
jgi:hypothetical protein